MYADLTADLTQADSLPPDIPGLTLTAIVDALCAGVARRGTTRGLQFFEKLLSSSSSSSAAGLALTERWRGQIESAFEAGLACSTSTLAVQILYDRTTRPNLSPEQRATALDALDAALTRCARQHFGHDLAFSVVREKYAAAASADSATGDAGGSGKLRELAQTLILLAKCGSNVCAEWLIGMLRGADPLLAHAGFGAEQVWDALLEAARRRGSTKILAFLDEVLRAPLTGARSWQFTDRRRRQQIELALDAGLACSTSTLAVQILYDRATRPNLSPEPRAAAQAALDAAVDRCVRLHFGHDLTFTVLQARLATAASHGGADPRELARKLLMLARCGSNACIGWLCDLYDEEEGGHGLPGLAPGAVLDALCAGRGASRHEKRARVFAEDIDWHPRRRQHRLGGAAQADRTCLGGRRGPRRAAGLRPRASL